MRLILLAFLIFLTPLDSIAETTKRVGRAPLFLLNERFPVRKYIKSAPQHNHAIAVLWDVARRNPSNLRRVLRHTKVTEIQIVLLNETCVRNRVCETTDALFGYSPRELRTSIARKTPKTRSRVKAQAKDAMAHLSGIIGRRKIMMNPFLETTLRRSQFNRAVRWITSEIGTIPMVWNPLSPGGDRPATAYFTESHGFAVKCHPDGRTIANLDGSRGSIHQMQDWLRRTRACRFSLLWLPADNCRLENEKTFVAPSKRACAGDFEKIRRIIR